jgi:hypothetical protein
MRAMKTRRTLAATTMAFISLGALPAHAAPANTLHELWSELSACLNSTGDVEGSEITIVFALRRDGALLGVPRITYSRLPGDADEQKRFVAGVVRALDKCLPLDLTQALGGAIAGRPLAIRIGRAKKETVI